MQNFEIQSGSWNELEHEAKLIRKTVFIQEQNIPEDEEWDTQDAISLHFVVYDKNKNTAIATARLLDNNSIGRVAVLKEYRGTGIGRLLMLDVIQHAKSENREFLKLSSQVHAIQFYEGLGFNTHGTEYLDCNIPHIDMILKI